MAKPKSLKLRTLITLYVLFKHTDENHRLNMTKLNRYLKPYNLECHATVLAETVKALREFGVEVENKGEWDHQGIWMKNRPLSESELNYLVFAVTSNPHLSKEQATNALQGLKPLVTEYQEHLLTGFVETKEDLDVDDTLYWVYFVIHDAIKKKRRIRYSVDYAKYHQDTQSVEMRREWMTLFTPKCLYQANNGLYMIGFNHNDKKIAAVNLLDITDIKMAFKHKDVNAEIAQNLLDGVRPQDVVPGELNRVIYSGPVTFRCRGQYLGELYTRFGPPDEPVVKDARCKALYTIENTEITVETLNWLSKMPNYGIRIAGPDELIKKTTEYYQSLATTLVSVKKL